MQPPPRSTLFPYTTLFRSLFKSAHFVQLLGLRKLPQSIPWPLVMASGDRKSTRLNSSHLGISYAVFCLKKKNSELNMSGQRARSNLVNVDGEDAVDNSLNGIRSTVSQEAVQEFQIQTAGYSAEYGRASGGVVNIVTRDRKSVV